MEDQTGTRSNPTLEIPRYERKVSHCIEVQDDTGSRRIPVGSTPIVFGQSRSADVRVVDETVSGRHCEVVERQGSLFIRDLGSKNGTYAGGARVLEAWAGPGTVVTLGATTLTVFDASTLDSEPEPAAPLPGLIGGSTAMRRVASQVRRLARGIAPVLILGETGTGKELVARALHTEGARCEGPWVPINVATLPQHLVDSELFGFERGAFTGAVKQRNGAFIDARGGTLFLDEIGELPLESQPKLLRALDGYQVRRIGAAGGGEESDARVVAATHVPLDECVEEGKFRRDLFHRLEVFVIELPPLRDRRGDIPAIARDLLGRMEPEIGRRVLSPAAVGQLAAHDWPGNVRDLRNTLIRAAHLAEDDRRAANAERAQATGIHELREPLRRRDAPIRIEAPHIDRAIRRAREEARSGLTPALARAILDRSDGSISAAARTAGVPRSTFRKLLQRK